jgi:hypothetical protein
MTIFLAGLHFAAAGRSGRWGGLPKAVVAHVDCIVQENESEIRVMENLEDALAAIWERPGHFTALAAIGRLSAG